MSEHHAQLRWKRKTADFVYETYDRTHTIRFGGGTELQSTAAKEFLGNPAISNPEEQLVGALSSCHMLTFLAICARSRLTLDSYEDSAVGYLEKNSEGKLAVTRVTLKPLVKFSGSNIPDSKKIQELHEKAHTNCFIANSVKCHVDVKAE